MSGVGEYEKRSRANIASNKAVLSKLMSDIKDHIPTKPPKNPRRKSLQPEDLVARRNPSRGARVTPLPLPPMRTRSRRGSVSSSISSASSSTSAMTSPDKLVVRLGFFQRQQSRDSAENSDDYEDDKLPSSKRQPRYQREIKSVDEITDEDLDMVAMFVSDKAYDSAYGSSCHQCRQKTNDMKTVCRSGSCLGVRGQFCGPCLRNRYGEDAKEALKNPSWVCPPCRGICNCSFCRKKAGRCCTGIMIHMARDNGYQDVNTYLHSLKK